MGTKIDDILSRMKVLEQDLQAELDLRRAQFRYRLEDRKVRFERGILAQQRRFREGLFRYVLGARPKHLLVALVIYPVFVPMVLFDLAVTLYQWLCFPLYGIPRVRRRDYMVYDRHNLAYLNLLEKLNCHYCSYANGLMSYCKEVVARTEQYWCPIKHARRVLQAHARYERFAEFGDAEGYRRELPNIRKDFKD